MQARASRPQKQHPLRLAKSLPRKTCNKKEIDFGVVPFFFCFFFFLSFVFLGTSILVFKVCNQVAPFVLKLPCFKALLNESCVYSFFLPMILILVFDIISILTDT